MKISFKAHQAACLLQRRLAHAECLEMQTTHQAHGDAMLLALMSFMSCYSRWQLKGGDETGPAGTDGSVVVRKDLSEVGRRVRDGRALLRASH